MGAKGLARVLAAKRSDHSSRKTRDPPSCMGHLLRKRGVGKMKQPLLNLNPISGIEWLVRKMVSEVADTAVAISELTRGAE